MIKLKILQVLPDFNSGGVERGTFEIATYLKDQNIDNLVCSNGGALVKKLEKLGVKHVKLSVNSKNPLIIIKNIFKLAGLIKTQKINIVHARSRAPAWSCYFACKLTNTKFITTFHSAYSSAHPLKRLYNSVMLKGNWVIAISKYIKKHIETRYHFTSQNLVVIDRGVNTEFFNSSNINESKLLKLKKEIGLKLDKDEKLIILPARFTRLKGHLYLLKALKYMNFKKYKCLFIGKVNDVNSLYIHEIEHFIKENKLDDKVLICKNPTDDMVTLYHLADLVISASLEPEGFGRTIIEAQAMGKIVISTNIGAPYDIIKHGKTGYLVPTSDASTLAEMIDYVLSMDSGASLKIINQAIKIVNEKYSLDKMCEKTLKVYRSAINDDE